MPLKRFVQLILRCCYVSPHRVNAVCFKVVTSCRDDDNSGIFHVFEMRIGMNDFDHRIFASSDWSLFMTKGKEWLRW